MLRLRCVIIRSLIAYGLWISKILLAKGLLKFKRHFLKMLRPTEFKPASIGTKYSRVDQVKFLKGCLPRILLGPLLNTWNQLSLSINCRKFIAMPDIVNLFKSVIKSNKYEKDFSLNILQEWQSFLTEHLNSKDANPNSWYSFSEDVPLVVLVTTMPAFYWTDSSFFMKREVTSLVMDGFYINLLLIHVLLMRSR